MPYAIKCITEGEQRLAQDILFKKGFTWLFRERGVRFREGGQWLILRNTTITCLHLDQYEAHHREYQEITMSELLHV